MKTIKIFTFLVFTSLFFSLAWRVYAADCVLPYDGSWTVSSNCTWPDGYKIYGDIVVWSYTITMWANDDMWIDLATNKITFTTWKIDLATTARIDNHITTRYYVSRTYSTVWTWVDCNGAGWNQCTHCPSPMLVFDTASGTPPSAAWTTNFRWATVRSMPSSWTFYCGI